MLYTVSGLLLAALVLGSCGDDEADRATQRTNWGPLAVIEGPPNGEDALVGGVLDISENCVSIGRPGGEHRTTLAWPSETTRWDADAGTISYMVALDGEQTWVEVASGDEVSFGGGHKDTSSNIDWVVEPDPSCPGDGAFYVGGYSEGFETGP
jgi:hypothetical protein